MTATDLIRSCLPNVSPPEQPITCGGTWFGKYRMTDPNFVLQKGDTLRVYISTTQGERYHLPENHIVFESDDICVVYKPPGVSSSQDRSNLFHNLTEGVRAYYASKDNTYDPTPITRLDFMVQGLALFAKHKQAEIELFRLTKDRLIKKHYLALLPKFDDAPKKRIVDLPLNFTNKARVDAAGKTAKTLFVRHSDLSENTTAYMVKLFTGRRHQIRAHAAKSLLPLLGDGLYGSRRKHTEQHIGLIAYKYVFSLFGISYRIVLPNALEKIIPSDWRGR